jgi:hypothetical protein
MRRSGRIWYQLFPVLPLLRGSERELHKKEFLIVKPLLTSPYQGRNETQKHRNKKITSNKNSSKP